ncbi:MAG: thiamine diphosphokinase [Candidatus Cloacimonadales bacterium]
MLKAIVVNGSALSKQRFLEIIAEVDELIAADGGANICRQYGIEPDIIIGDLDSWQQEQPTRAQIISVPDQERTDLQKALEYADLENCEKVKIISAWGKRSDHSMVNMIILSQSKFPEKLEIYDDFSKTILLAAGRHEIEVPPKNLISFYAFGSVQNLSLQGVEYELKQQDFAQGFCGISNITRSKRIDVSLDKGLLFCAIAE